MEILWHTNVVSPPLSGSLLERMYAAVQQPDYGVVLFSNNPEQEMNQMVATVGLLLQWRSANGVIVAATSHPTAQWQEKMRQLGTHQQWAVANPSPMLTSSHILSSMIVIRAEPCPFLRNRVTTEGTLSICGACAHSKVVSIPHFRKWCLSDPSTCPSYKVATRQAPLPSYVRTAIQEPA
ncbi:MAG: hypothetical protein G8345_02535 [Magnetococcales bacterium]|nr:hypothetical protein [Magnetococcales bacterium]NGZ25748.1 hypothetical protein [Magnetococcales bacterium]